MGNSTSRVVGCFASPKNGVELAPLGPLDEGLGHSFCYVRPSVSDSPITTPSASGRFTLDSFDSETTSGSFRHVCESHENVSTFKAISGASVSANVSTARSQSACFGDAQEPAASFESTACFSAVPLQPVPRGAEPVNSFMSGPLERGGGFLSGPMEKGFLSGPILGFPEKKPKLRFFRGGRFIKGGKWLKKMFQQREERGRLTLPGEECDLSRSLQWAHGKAGEDRVHVVLSEEQGWLFIGIYDGFSGPDAPEFLMCNLYKTIDRELEGVLWDYECDLGKSDTSRGGRVAPFAFDRPMRLFELLQMETLGVLESPPSTSGEEGGASTRRQKSLREKLFSWNREEVGEENPRARKCRTGNVDHCRVLRSMAIAFGATEDAYMSMVEGSLDQNPELALMGSCVLVMLMKDQDVYVLNLGDSRAVLAQERPNFPKSREAAARKELDRISEESPVHNLAEELSAINKNREISFCRLKMRALQLSSDHSTSVKEEVSRIISEHADDDEAILNDRVKGHLKVTRAFGAGFLKKQNCNEALLEMFRINYIGNFPYISSSPFLLHHRLGSCDRFLVLSSDGLYEYFSNEEVVAHVAWFMENVPEGDPAQYLIAELLSRAAKKNGMDFHELLGIPHGDRRKYHDDVSVMVVSFEGRIWKSSG